VTGPAGTLLAVLATAAWAGVTAGCGGTSHTSAPVPVVTTAVTSAAPAAATPGPPPAATGESAESQLSAVEDDQAAVDAATAQSDADFAAGTAAQAENDGP
jgi:hypothetical protein